MQTGDELGKGGEPHGFTARQSECDYLQHLALFVISRSEAGDYIFKGGTALQKAYDLPRFSEDLDFTFNGRGDPESILRYVIEGLTPFGIRVTPLHPKRRTGSFRSTLLLEGPLFQEGADRSTIKLEVSLRERCMVEPRIRFITPPHEDLPPYNILVMDPEEILAEKVRAILTRNSARDVFDIHHLSESGYTVGKELISAKLALHEVVRAGFNLEDVLRSLRMDERVWNREMNTLMRDPPSLEKVIADLEDLDFIRM